MRIDRRKAGLPDFHPPDNEMRSFMGSMPHTQVAVSIKTSYHKNPLHKWTVNDIVDIDAVSVAFSYCEAVFPDKAVRAALLNLKGAAGHGDVRASAPPGTHRVAERFAGSRCP
jgi:hypothetical protein